MARKSVIRYHALFFLINEMFSVYLGLERRKPNASPSRQRGFDRREDTQHLWMNVVGAACAGIEIGGAYIILPG